MSRHLCTCQDFLKTALSSRQLGWPTCSTGRTLGQARQDRPLLGRRDRSTRQSLSRTNYAFKTSRFNVQVYQQLFMLSKLYDCIWTNNRRNVKIYVASVNQNKWYHWWPTDASEIQKPSYHELGGSFPNIRQHLRKFRSCSKISNIFHIILKWPWLVLEADGIETSVLRNKFLTNQISIINVFS